MRGEQIRRRADGGERQLRALGAADAVVLRGFLPSLASRVAAAADALMHGFDLPAVDRTC